MILSFESDYSFSKTISYLVQLQLDLQKLLRDCAVTEENKPGFSLFSSKKVYKKEELNIELHTLNHFCEFSRN